MLRPAMPVACKAAAAGLTSHKRARESHLQPLGEHERHQVAQVQRLRGGALRAVGGHYNIQHDSTATQKHAAGWTAAAQQQLQQQQGLQCYIVCARSHPPGIQVKRLALLIRVQQLRKISTAQRRMQASQ